MQSLQHDYDFKGATFDLSDPLDRKVVQFILSQALFGEATGVYCGKSLYAARSLEAARFYVRQAHQELNHLELFAQIFRALDMQPTDSHWVIRLLSSHNNYYPLKVLMEHAIGEGMVLDIFKDVMLQTLPDSDPAVAGIKKKLRSICIEEKEHVEWGEKETKNMLAAKPWLRWPYYGLVELQLMVAPLAARTLMGKHQDHPVLCHVPSFITHIKQRIVDQCRELGFYPEERPNFVVRGFAMLWGVLLFTRSQFSRGRSKLDKNYISELGFEST